MKKINLLPDGWNWWCWIWLFFIILIPVAAYDSYLAQEWFWVAYDILVWPIMVFMLWNELQEIRYRDLQNYERN